MKDNLKDELRAAMKAKDKIKLDTLRGLLTSIQYEEIQKNVENLPEESIVAILKNEVKKRKETLEYAVQGKREEEQKKLLMEIAIIEKFLPQQISEAELESIIVGFKKTQPEINMGQAMKLLKEHHAGQYDGKTASEVAKRVLG